VRPQRGMVRLTAEDVNRLFLRHIPLMRTSACLYDPPCSLLMMRVGHSRVVTWLILSDWPIV